MFVTTEYLRSLDACEGQVKVFAMLFPNGAEVTRENLERALKVGLNLDWFGEHALGEPYLAEMAAHDFEYNEKAGAALSAYEHFMATTPSLEEAEAAHSAYYTEIGEARAKLNSAVVEVILNLLSKE